MHDFTIKILKNLIEVKSAICIADAKTNLDLYDFDFRQYFETKPIINGTDLPIILRIGAIDNYGQIEGKLNELGLKLINTTKEHDIASLLPNWYPLISELTPKSKWYEQTPTIEQILQDFDLPIFVKGERQTNRHKYSLSVANSKKDLKRILDFWQKDPILNWQRVICREFVQLKKIGDTVDDQVQFSKEFRAFVWKNKVIEIGNYWTEAGKIDLSSNEKDEIIKLVEKVAEKVQVPFLVVDIAQKTDGNWIVIELNDAQESGYVGVNRLLLWEKITRIN